jgi:hypothetical protein
MNFVQGTGRAIPIVRDFPILASADATKGTLFLKGPTPGTDGGCAILASGACADVLGLLNEDYDFSAEGSSNVGSGTDIMKPFELNPLAFIRAEIDQSDTMAATQADATTTITLTSLEDNIDHAFLYCVAGDAIGQLRVIATSASGSCTVKTAFSPAVASGDTFIKIYPSLFGLVKLNAAATGLGTDAAAGTAVVSVVSSWMQSINTGGIEMMNATSHSGLNNINGKGQQFFSDLIFRNHIFNSID